MFDWTEHCAGIFDWKIRSESSSGGILDSFWNGRGADDR
jgi:hypothetical protein